MTKTIGTVTGVNGNMVTVRAQGTVTMNEVAYIVSDGRRLKSEVIRVQAETVQVQVFEITRGIQVGDAVEFSGELLSVELGPGLLGQIYDGLQNPLPLIAEKTGNFLEPGVYLDALAPGQEMDLHAFGKGRRPGRAGRHPRDGSRELLHPPDHGSFLPARDLYGRLGQARRRLFRRRKRSPSWRTRKARPSRSP